MRIVRYCVLDRKDILFDFHGTEVGCIVLLGREHVRDGLLFF